MNETQQVLLPVHEPPLMFAASHPQSPVRLGVRPSRHVVLLHGLASTPKEFALLAHPLRRRGIELHAPVIRGYSQGTLTHRTQWQDWVHAAAQTVDTIAARHGPLIVGGLCTGAILALAVVAIGAARPVRGLALLSPLLAYDGWALPWWYRLRTVAYMLGVEEHFSMKERSPFGLKNERMRHWVRQQMVNGEASLAGPASVSLREVRESERISSHARSWLAGLDVPTLLLHARYDEICSLDRVRAAAAAVPAGLLHMAVLENSYHMITADNDRELVAERVAEHARCCVADVPELAGS